MDLKEVLISIHIEISITNSKNHVIVAIVKLEYFVNKYHINNISTALKTL
jgi:hypothetical protein